MMKKGKLALLLCLCLCLLAAVLIPTVVFAAESSLSETQVRYVQAEDAEDVSVSLRLHEDTLDSITYQDSASDDWKQMTEGTEYIVTDDQYTFSAAFLNQLPLGTLTICFHLVSGDKLSFTVQLEAEEDQANDAGLSLRLGNADYDLTADPAEVEFSLQEGDLGTQKVDITLTNTGKKKLTDLAFDIEKK